MIWFLPLLMFVIMFVCMATLYSEGIWSNAVRLINVMTAALLASNFFEPIARWLDRTLSAGSYAWDFMSLWILFAIFYGLMRTATDLISRVRVRFHKIADQIGGGFFALWISWLMICFTMMSLHTAPLSRNFLFGGFQPEQRMLGFAPDRQWLGFLQKVSMGAFRRSATADERQSHAYVADPDADSRYAVFNEHGDFMWKYATRREEFAHHLSEYQTILVSPQGGPPPPPHN